jgi:N6-L-threonylcarbamoyladenine synthase
MAEASPEAAMTEFVLGIETSCDETAAAVVRGGRDVLSNVVMSQTELHARFRGVVPEVASRSHTARIVPAIERALSEAGVAAHDLAAVAVTHRPGMIGCLLVGLAAAKAMAWYMRIPLVAVDHIAAHLHAAFMTDPDAPTPMLGLVASGGHTALYLSAGPGEAERVGRTLDDAAGEALDKGAALLGLPYPGGPAIEEAARAGRAGTVALPRGVLGPDSLDFSFSGIKTALLYHLRGPGLERPLPALSAAEVADAAASYQACIVDVLVERMARAVRRHPVRSLAIGGGVARNGLLRARLREHRELGQLHLVLPPPALCSDNGAMVAGLGALKLARGELADLALEAVATSRRA